MLRTVIAAAVLAGALHGQAAAQTGTTALPLPVQQALREGGLPDEALGAVVLRGNTVLVSHGAERSMNPASTLKLLTTFVGLDQLGPAFRGRTELRSTAQVADGVLQGDLYLRGGADADFNEDALVHMLERLRAQGIRTIAGDLVLDRQLFRPARLDVGRAPFDDAPQSYYNVIPDALLLNMNMLRIDVRATETQLQLAMLPELDGVAIASDMTLADASCAQWDAGWREPTVERRDGKLTVVLHGTFPKNCTATRHASVLDRDDYAGALFRATWKRLGGTLGGAVRVAAPDQATPATALVLVEHVSRALPETIRDTNKTSDNTLARLLFLSLGSLDFDAVAGSRPALFDDGAGAGATTAMRAEQRVRSWMRRNGIADEGLVIENGAGLSRNERLRPAQLAALLRVAQRSPWLPELQASMPIVAVDGTMRRRLLDSPAAARARIKTGTLNGVVAVAGYVPDASGEPCIVVALVNHELAGNGNGRKVVDALIDWVARSAP